MRLCKSFEFFLYHTQTNLQDLILWFEKYIESLNASGKENEVRMNETKKNWKTMIDDISIGSEAVVGCSSSFERNRRCLIFGEVNPPKKSSSWQVTTILRCEYVCFYSVFESFFLEVVGSKELSSISK